MKKLNFQEELFLNMIKPTIMSESLKYKISPSIIASLAITESKWGTSKLFGLSRNVFHLKVDSEWFGKCYDERNQITYNKKEDCDIIGSILYRVYTKYEDSIIDFISYLTKDKRSINGPLRYRSIFNCIDYKEFLNRLVRSGFMQYYLNRNDDISYIQNLLTIVEKYELYTWDNSLKETIKTEEDMSKKNRNNRIMIAPPINAIVTTDEEEDKTVVGAEEIEPKESETNNRELLETFSHMYRVRLDWEKPDTQIFASPIYEDAKKEALSHEGYKIYIDDDGVLFEDPWIKIEPEEKEVSKLPPNIKRVTHVLPGKLIKLVNTPIYSTAISRFPMKHLSGSYVFYDGTISKGRAKIISKENYKNNRNINNIIGWIKIE